MTYRLNDEEALLRKTVRDFATSTVGPLVGPAEAAGRFPRDQVIGPMADLGLLAIGVPEKAGGAGGTTLMMCLIAEEIARVSGGFAISVMASVLAPSALLKMESAGLAATMLGPLMRGQILPLLPETSLGEGLLARGT